MRRAAFPLSIVMLGMLVFLAWMHPAVLWPTNVGWLLTGEDRGQSAIGLAAYLHAGGPWPSLHQPLLAGPEGMTLLFTDSIPLLGLLLKPMAPLLPVDSQYVGIWYLACTLLQAGFAAALVRRYAPDALAAWCGAALLTLMPALFNRYGHASLCAQWLLLWSLWIFADPRRSRHPGWWATVLGVAALVHSYLLIMVLAFWAGAFLERLLREPGKVRTLLGGILALLPAAAFMVAHGVLAGPYVSTHTYGAFPAALDAWWNPANPDYAALIPSSPRAADGMGFEGLQYLGAGLLSLVLLMLAQTATGRLDVERRDVPKRLLWLAPSFLPLALLAVGPTPLWRGVPLAVVHLPPHLIDSLDFVRAGGRLLWPATYTLAFAAIVAATGRARGTLVLGATLALQVIDLGPMLAAVRQTSRRADDPQTFTRTTDPHWATLIARSSAIQFEPSRRFTDLQLMEEIGWRAVVACRPLRYFYASRETVSTRARIDADSVAFAAGRLDPSRLYILSGDVPMSRAVAARVSRLEGVRFIAPIRSTPPGQCEAQNSLTIKR